MTLHCYTLNVPVPSNLCSKGTENSRACAGKYNISACYHDELQYSSSACSCALFPSSSARCCAVCLGPHPRVRVVRSDVEETQAGAARRHRGAREGNQNDHQPLGSCTNISTHPIVHGHTTHYVCIICVCALGLLKDISDSSSGRQDLTIR